MIIVRHGESTYNIEYRIQGQCDESTLTETGRQGALQVAEALQGIVVDQIYASPLKRAQETAELIASRLALQSSQSDPSSQPLQPQFTDDLKEINLPPWEGMTFDQVQAQYPDEYRLWRQEAHNLVFKLEQPDGVVEFYPLRSLYEQAQQFWDATLPHHEGQTLIVVAHSAINRALISTAIGLSTEQFSSLYQSNCGISVLNVDRQKQTVQMESMNLTAHLGQSLPKIRRGMEGIRLLLVRHGETEWNRQQRFQGQIDVPLNDNGRHQGQQVANFLQTIKIDQAVSSPMLRPKETAEMILQHHPDVSLTLDDGLREISHGRWEGKLESEIEAEFPGELERWQTVPAVVQMPDGENLQQVWERVIASWNAIVAKADESTDKPLTVLVVAHDAVNKAILCHVAGLGAEHFWSFKQGNGAVSVIDYPYGAAGRPVLRAMNITTHLGSVLDTTAAGAL